MKSIPTLLIAASLVIAARPACADPATDVKMRQLAATSGCVACHTVERKPASQDTKPIGPPWQEVAARYRGQADARQRLVKTVLAGSNPYYAHWKDKVSGYAMPPNAVAISDANADALVGWILRLP